MSANGEFVAVLDRFEDELAVLVLEADDETVGELVVHASRLPDDARHQDAVLFVTLDDGRLVDAEYDESETERRRTNAQRRFDRLSSRPPNDQRDDRDEPGNSHEPDDSDESDDRNG